MSTLSRRALLAAVTTSAAGITFSPQPAAAAVPKPVVESTKLPRSGQYMVGDTECACDWRWKIDAPVWRMSSKEGVSWNSDGPLTEKGREMLLKHFGLEAMAGELPLESIRTMSPAELIFTRRRLEDELGPMLGERLVAISDHPTFKFRAEEVV